MDKILWWQWLLIGIGLGLIAVAVTWIVLGSKLIASRRRARRENDKLRKMLEYRMELESTGLEKLRDENEELKRQVQNLTVSLQTLSQKPNKRDIQRLQVYQTAIDRLMINTPGFGPAWQSALKESEEEFSKIFTGALPFLRRFIPLKSDASLIEDDK